MEICIFVIICHKWNQSFFQKTRLRSRSRFLHIMAQISKHTESHKIVILMVLKRRLSYRRETPLDAVALSVEVLSTNNGGGYHKQIAWSYVSLRNDFCNRQFLFGYRHSYLWYTYGIVTIGSAVAQARANSVSHYTRNAERLNWTELVVNMLIITSCQFSSIKWDSSPCENESQVSHRCYKLNWDDRMLLMILKLSPSAQRNFL